MYSRATSGYRFEPPNVRFLNPIRVLTIAVLLWAWLLDASEVAYRPYRGVIWTERTEHEPRELHLHVVQIDLRASGLRFKLSPPAGARDAVRQTTLEFLKQERAQIAINAHFFVPFPSTNMDANLVGLAASEGVVYSPFEPQPVAYGYEDQGYAILSYAPALNIDQLNRACIVHRDPAFADSKHVLERVRLWNTVSGSAQIITAGMETIPIYSGAPNGLHAQHGYGITNSWYSQFKARTIIGLTRDRSKLMLLVVDAAGGSHGMSLGETARLLIDDYHVYNALNLDGGGSTSMAMQDPKTHTARLMSVSSDNPLGRAVGSSLAVFAAPEADNPRRK